MDSNLQSMVRLKRKISFGRILFLYLLLSLLLTAGCSALPVHSNNSENPDRFALAEQYGQFVSVNQSVDCKGTKVTIEKAG